METNNWPFIPILQFYHVKNDRLKEYPTNITSQPKILFIQTQQFRTIQEPYISFSLPRKQQ